ncbi:protein of unknown function [Pseudotevenvirus RB43]|uniref:Uncharacterized protein n=2 Tax=Pseudotevenvirus RB43 TaxID=115991 RepID=Q56BK3_9CAUD|nr:hypothetical protein RB43ORF195c [Escherichia phage RB43]AAX78717.1 hypothetical protein RB43ORF195c [Escherichia phage RB43]CCK74039.1 protein of unknown function [Pseudotevenvirus RB43]CCL97656.1 protein of unknown function [Pseudotevenvirus RB43]
MSRINDVRKEVNDLFNMVLGDFYTVKVSATRDHIADRFIDRSASIKKDFELYRDILHSLAKHYSCNVLYHAVQTKGGGARELIAYRRVNGKVFACVCTVQLFEEEKPVIALRLRTVIPEYEANINARNAINVNYVPPKIKFEYDGYRRVMSRLDRLIASPDCPPQLRMLKSI